MFKKITIAIVILLLLVLGVAYQLKPEPTPEPLVLAPTDPEVAAAMQDVVAANYCGLAQKILANTSLDAQNDIHLNYDSFVKSKPSDQPLISHQFINYLPVTVNGKEEVFPTILSCKVKTADRLKQVYGDDQAGEESNCSQLLRQDLESVLAELNMSNLVFSADNIVIEDDEVARMGPKWLSPWPYAVARIEGEKLILRSKSLLVPFSDLIPMPDRFKGTHYCHLPTPQYLKGILRGEIVSLVEPVVADNSN